MCGCNLGLTTGYVVKLFTKLVFIKTFCYNRNYSNNHTYSTHTHNICLYSCKGLLLHIHTYM